MSKALPREDGRRPLLVYLKPEVVQALKRRALDLDTYAYLLLEDILEREPTLKIKPASADSDRSKAS